jgi:hypothetical protein
MYTLKVNVMIKLSFLSHKYRYVLEIEAISGEAWHLKMPNNK